MKSKLRLAGFWIAALVLVGAVATTVLASQSTFENMGIVKPRIEKNAPGFSLQNIHGETVDLRDFRGKPILLNFWATWCEACKEELPSMQRLYETLKDQGVEVVAISIDRSNFDRIRKYVEQYKLTFPILLDPDQKVRRSYFIMGLPTTYLIDGDGKLKGFASGARVWDSPDSIQVMQSLKQ